MIDVSRHKELFNPENFNTPIHIIGLGATGSWLALTLAKLGINGSLIHIYDADIIEEHNIANQAYAHRYYRNDPRVNTPYIEASDVGNYKLDAMYRIMRESANCYAKAIPGMVGADHRFSGIVFLMVDTMKTRKLIWDNCIKMKPAVKLLVEPRMGLDIGRVYNVNPCNLNHIKEYENTYYDDDVAEVSACGNSMTVISTALGIASWCTRQLINYDNDIELDNEILIDFKYNNIVTTKWEGV